MIDVAKVRGLTRKMKVERENAFREKTANEHQATTVPMDFD